MGSDGREYVFLLKGHEDLRQDERVMQLFGLVNTLLAVDASCARLDLGVHILQSSRLGLSARQAGACMQAARPSAHARAHAHTHAHASVSHRPQASSDTLWCR